MNKFLGILAAVALFFGGLALWLHGNAKYQHGLSKGRNECLASNVIEADKARQTLEKAQNNAKKIPDTDLVRRGNQLGIVRPDADR
jgi:hypothetical protein